MRQIALVLFLAACTKQPADAYTSCPAGPSPDAAHASFAAPLSSGNSLTDFRSPLSRPAGRLFPSPDDLLTPSQRRRYGTMVLLYAAPPSLEETRPLGDRGLAHLSRLRFEPMLCVIAGKLQAGLLCGEVMPERVEVRTTAGRDLSVRRRTVPFHDEAGHLDYAAPYAPSCCMYNTCVGRTIPYEGIETSFGVPHAEGTVLAVWPRDAEIDLIARTADEYDPNENSRWAQATGAMGPDSYVPIATTDLNGDKKRELLIFERWANDSGIFVVPAAGEKALYRSSCGNI